MGSRPLGITIIAIVMIISGVVSVVAGAEALGYTKLGLIGQLPSVQQYAYGQLIGGVITVIVALALFTLKGWAWVLCVFILAIDLLFGIWAVVILGVNQALGISAIGQVVVAGILMWYLFRDNVRAAFGR